MIYDLHCHSIRSNDATSTIIENVEIAKGRNVDVIAITDHGPGMIDGPDPSYFYITTRIPPVINGVKVLCGCESNILDKNGKLDLEDAILREQDIVLAGIHELTSYSTRNMTDNTKAMIAAMKNKNVDIIAHPYRDIFPVDLSEVLKAAKDYGVLLEFNAHVIQNIKDDNTIDLYLKCLGECKENNYPYSIGSDAHFAYEIGNFSAFHVKNLEVEFNLFEKEDCRLIEKLKRNSKFNKISF